MQKQPWKKDKSEINASSFLEIRDSLTGESNKVVIEKYLELEPEDSNEFEMLMMFTTWDKEEFPLAAEYCQSKQHVFQAIRDSINSSSGCYAPYPRSGYRDWNGVSFARDMLTIDANYQVGSGNLNQALENCKSLSRLSDLWLPYAATYLEHSEQIRLRGWTNCVLARIVAHPDCSPQQCKTVKKLVFDRSNVLARFGEQRGEMLVMNLARLEYWIREGEFYSYRQIIMPGPEYNRRSFNWHASIRRVDSRIVDLQTLVQETEGLTNNIEAVRDFEAQEESDMEQLDSFLSQTVCCLGSPNQKGAAIAQIGWVDGWSQFAWVLRSQQCQLVFSEIVVALELFRKANGNYPKSLDELVPDVLNSVPYDPYQYGDLVYRASKKGFELYSVGRNGVDEGGESKMGIDDIPWENSTTDIREYIMGDEKPSE